MSTIESITLIICLTIICLTIIIISILVYIYNSEKLEKMNKLPKIFNYDSDIKIEDILK